MVNTTSIKSMARVIAWSLAVFMILVPCAISASAADKVTYSGRGSESSPYMIQTAEQLDGIRQNLSAHYKLANTIDLSSISNFAPIGSIASPFKGSLVCDKGADGKPLYAIKNLKINNNPAGSTSADKYSGYKSDGTSGWEAGLFGCAEGSAFTNILVLDATVTNTVEGKFQMNADWSINPGGDEQAAGILVAIGKSLTVSGCGVSGKVTSSSNHVGGMLGNVADTSVTNCYSYANVTSTGSWGSGGLVGSIKGTSSISSCFYKGTFSGGVSHAGAFAGSVYDENTKIKDCWAAGTVKTESSGCFLGTKVHTDGTTIENIDVASNCYTISKIEGRTKAQTNKKVKNNNYVSDEVGIFEIGFAAASQAEINAVFKAFDAWTVTDGSYPQLKNVNPVTDSSVYKVKAVTASDIAPTEQTASQETQSTDTSSSVADETTDVTSDADAVYNTIQDDSLLKMEMPERILIAVLTIFILAATAGSVITIILIRKKKPNM